MKRTSIFLLSIFAILFLFGCTKTESPKEEISAENKVENKVEKTEENKEENSEVKEEKKDFSNIKEETVYVDASFVKAVMNGEVAGYENYIIGEVGYGDISDIEGKNVHIPGAIYLDNRSVEDPTGKDYNYLSAEEIKNHILESGITQDTKLILYGPDVSGTARQAVAYLWAGVKDVKILNGGIDAWKKEGYDTTEKFSKYNPVSEFGADIPVHPEYILSLEEVQEKLKDPNFKLVSIRSKDEFLGVNSGYSYIDKAGEPEGAVWGKGPLTAYDLKMFTNDDNTVKDLNGFKEVWNDVDFTLDNDLSFYCGTGWRASVPFLVMYENGYRNMTVFDGGWYVWIQHPELDVQVGDPHTSDVKHEKVKDLPNDKALK